MNQPFVLFTLDSSHPLADNFTFSAKEKDSETGLSVTSLREVSSLRLGNLRTSSHCTRSLRRFGSRYYNSDLSIWLSVDPMASKYPSFSPYTYCANNPIKLVDPNGKEVIVTGDASDEVISQINNMTSKGFNVLVNSVGLMSYEGKAKTKIDRLIKRAINSKKETINIVANNSYTFTGRDGNNYTYEKDFEGNFFGGGAYGGCVVSDKHSTSYQYVNPQALSFLDNKVGDKKAGGYMLHEFAEGFYSARQGHRMGSDGVGGDNYENAHCRANNIIGGGWQTKTLPYQVEWNSNFFMFPRLIIKPGKTIVGYERSGN